MTSNKKNLIFLVGASILLILMAISGIEVFLHSKIKNENRNLSEEFINSTDWSKIEVIALGDSQPSNDLNIEWDNFANISYPGESILSTWVKLNLFFKKHPNCQPKIALVPAYYLRLNKSESDDIRLNSISLNGSDYIELFPEHPHLQEIFNKHIDDELRHEAYPLKQFTAKYRKRILTLIKNTYLKPEKIFNFNQSGSFIYPNEIEIAENLQSFLGDTHSFPTGIIAKPKNSSQARYVNPGQEIMHYYEKIIRFLKNKKITVAVVNYPNFTQALENTTKEFINTAYNFNQEIIKKHDLISLDYFSLFTGEKYENLFKNYDHLNETGSLIFASYIESDLSKILNSKDIKIQDTEAFQRLSKRYPLSILPPIRESNEDFLITASSYDSEEYSANYVFNNASSWVSNYKPTTEKAEWLKIELKTPIKFNRYSIKARSAGTPSPPAAWKLWSYSGNKKILLDEKINEEKMIQSELRFYKSKPIETSTILLEIFDSHGKVVDIGNLHFYELDK